MLPTAPQGMPHATPCESSPTMQAHIPRHQAPRCQAQDTPLHCTIHQRALASTAPFNGAMIGHYSHRCTRHCAARHDARHAVCQPTHQTRWCVHWAQCGGPASHRVTRPSPRDTTRTKIGNPPPHRVRRSGLHCAERVVL